jgi:hypothetical protein
MGVSGQAYTLAGKVLVIKFKCLEPCVALRYAGCEGSGLVASFSLKKQYWMVLCRILSSCLK